MDIYSITQEQYMQTTIQLSSQRKILQWLTHILAIVRNCTPEEAVPVFPLIQSLETLTRLCLMQRNSRKVYILLELEKSICGFST